MMRISPIQHFLLVFDHDADRLIETIPFGEDNERAVAAYAAKEKEFEGRARIEIVLIGSDSLETVKLTHANYFDGSAAASKYFSLAG
jgi:hypothetical protein